MDNLDIWLKVCMTPDSAKKTISGGKLNGFTDINPMWRLRRLTEIFGACGTGWKFRITDFHPVPGANGEVIAIVAVDLFYRLENGEWSDPIPGIGGSKLVDTAKGNLTTNDDGYKMAVSDAIGSACKCLGMSEDVYMSGSGGSKYSRQPEDQPPQPRQLPKTPSEAADTMLTFGKYKGQSIRQIFAKDKGYLVWALGEPKADPALKAAIQMVMEAFHASMQS